MNAFSSSTALVHVFGCWRIGGDEARGTTELRPRLRKRLIERDGSLVVPDRFPQRHRIRDLAALRQLLASQVALYASRSR